MNSGLANLTTLKAWLLPVGMRASEDYDAQILAIGRGVARQLEHHCGRTFGFDAAHRYEFAANREHVILPVYPLLELTTIEVRSTLAAGWVDSGAIDTLVESIQADAGLVSFLAPLGTHRERARITYSGGYWWNTSDDELAPDVQPEGSTALPADLLLAWQLQCEHVWAQRDKLGLGIAEKPSEIYSGALAKIELLPVVRDHLIRYIRYVLL